MLRHPRRCQRIANIVLDRFLLQSMDFEQGTMIVETEDGKSRCLFQLGLLLLPNSSQLQSRDEMLRDLINLFDTKIAQSLSGHFRKFLTIFGYKSPLHFAIAVDAHFGIEPTGIIKSARFNKCDVGHYCCVCEDWRPAFRAEVALNRLAAVPGVVKNLYPSLN
jgi:hypothetical protein